ncbi:restriction endonuclease subunit S [Anabaena cylindrica UHCC 0172]|uniref:restriction endonuclease subunit S n=1 Tax=Anabaena cylindrica TaxID=1165 RepID=UPI002B221714|nr:restriction endonuclease subunit S [Anabaena cylindrica]MEA5553407.1 restriction endonuclease subunit S [Anabaena cylindrica UHCC 0172]
MSKFYKGKTSKLIDLCESITDCHHSTPKWTNEGKIVIRNFNIKNGKLLLDEVSYTDEDAYQERISRNQPYPGDLIITREAPMGEVCIIPDGVECCLGQRLVLIKPNLNKINNKYLLYALLCEYTQKQIKQSNNTGSIVSNLRIPLLKNLDIPLNNNQDKIASILSSLDDKIELNNRINSELENLAKTIYDYWFVQFDFPDENGKPYKSSGGKMVYDQDLKREIPAVWEVKLLGEVLTIVRGSSPRPIDNFLSDNGLPWIKISDATSSNNRFIFETKQFILEEGIPYTRHIPPDTLILSNSATPGLPRIVKISAGVHDGWLIIMNYKKGLTQEFMYHYFSFEQRRVVSFGSGSIFKNLKTDYIKNLKIALPAKLILEKVSPKFKEISELISIKSQENQQLTQLRDWLLPMLMNGQITVK